MTEVIKFYPERLADGSYKECDVCGISSFAHLHKPYTLPKDFEIIEEFPIGCVNIPKEKRGCDHENGFCNTSCFKEKSQGEGVEIHQCCGKLKNGPHNWACEEDILKNWEEEFIKLLNGFGAYREYADGEIVKSFIGSLLQAQTKQILSRVKDEYQKYHLQFDTETFMKVVEAKISGDPKKEDEMVQKILNQK